VFYTLASGSFLT